MEGKVWIWMGEHKDWLGRRMVRSADVSTSGQPSGNCRDLGLGANASPHTAHTATASLAHSLSR